MSSTHPAHEGTSLLSEAIALPKPRRWSLRTFGVVLFVGGLLLGMMLDGILQGPPQGGMLDARGKGKFRRTQFFGFGINTGGSDSSVQCSNRTGVGYFGDSLEVSLWMMRW